jgi:REP element-mobilizing transposase RayT
VDTVVDVPQQSRAESPTGFFHVTSRALQPLMLFEDTLDYTAFLHGLARAVRKDGLELHAYCLMGTHFHLLVRADAAVLSSSMRRLKGWYTQMTNDRRGRVGRYSTHGLEHCHWRRRYRQAVATEAKRIELATIGSGHRPDPTSRS